MEFSPDTWLRALRFAAGAHGDQKTPFGLPYVVHVTSVCMEVVRALRAEPGRDEELAVACALLHDTLEDTATPAELLEGEFGSAVLAGVRALTKDEAVPKSERMADSLRRILEQPREIAMVKMADRITNLAPPPPHWSAQKISSYREEARSIHGALSGASPLLAARLAQRIEAYPGR